MFSIYYVTLNDRIKYQEAILKKYDKTINELNDELVVIKKSRENVAKKLEYMKYLSKKNIYEVFQEETLQDANKTNMGDQIKPVVKSFVQICKQLEKIEGISVQLDKVIGGFDFQIEINKPLNNETQKLVKKARRLYNIIF